jgi:DNA-binding transcriptional LysR family regulator
VDIEVLRTFLEVARTRHFARAAERLFVTQAAVSARIAHLEEVIGSRVFTRQRNNIQLTTAGRKLVPHAEAIIGAWNRARLETGRSSEAGSLLAMGCLPSISEIFLDDLLRALRARGAEVLLQVEVLNSVALVSRVRDQSLDLALLYEPPRAGDLEAEVITSIELVLVSTTPGLSVADELPSYVYVDWGTSFAIAQETGFDRPPRPSLRLDTPGPAHRFLLGSGGTAYLARRMVDADLRAGRLHPVAGATEIERPVYLLHGASRAAEPETAVVIEALRSVT